ncbi:hypothetical protein CLSA_c16420 [Clostridium saccharobutylicum DSM 13864]|uniref:Uncharacterized protein n=1 Tax=Clostridium saccharobutylicum DSM 13864 TaxID=1345695 RepID=U5MPY4_CLOSA|nr:hypothetical protein CLSA_c16420 [Clostridium saccharobutylicum DSM 13864]
MYALKNSQGKITKEHSKHLEFIGIVMFIAILIRKNYV